MPDSLADAIGFQGMNAQERAEYLRYELRTHIRISFNKYAKGIDIVRIFKALEVPVDEAGFVNNCALLMFVYDQLNVADSLRVAVEDERAVEFRAEEVINDTIGREPPGGEGWLRSKYQ